MRTAAGGAPGGMRRPGPPGPGRGRSACRCKRVWARSPMHATHPATCLQRTRHMGPHAHTKHVCTCVYTYARTPTYSACSMHSHLYLHAHTNPCTRVHLNAHTTHLCARTCVHSTHRRTHPAHTRTESSVRPGRLVCRRAGGGPCGGAGEPPGLQGRRDRGRVTGPESRTPRPSRRRVAQAPGAAVTAPRQEPLGRGAWKEGDPSGTRSCGAPHGQG